MPSTTAGLLAPQVQSAYLRAPHWLKSLDRDTQFLLNYLLYWLHQLPLQEVDFSRRTWRISNILVAVVGSSVTKGRRANDIDLVIVVDIQTDSDDPEGRKHPWPPDIHSMVCELSYNLLIRGANLLDELPPTLAQELKDFWYWLTGQKQAARPKRQCKSSNSPQDDGASLYGGAVVKVDGCMPIHLLVKDSSISNWGQREENQAGTLLLALHSDYLLASRYLPAEAHKKENALAEEFLQSAHRHVLSDQLCRKK